MMVKIFSRDKIGELEMLINNFLIENEDIYIKDIKFQNTSDSIYDHCFAMILYEENKN